MPIIIEKYDPNKVESLKRLLQRESDRGRARDFEIVIDGFKVISRTNNPAEFDDFEQELTNESRNLSIIIYDSPGTNRNTKYSFSFNEDDMLQVRSGGTLNGIGLGKIDKLVEQQVKEKERDRELELLKEELEATRTKLKQCEDYKDILENNILEFKNRSFTDNLSMGEVLKAMFGSVLRDNAHRLPGGEALAGWFAGPQPGQELPQGSEQSSVSFQKKQPAEQLDEMTQHRLSLIADLQKKLDEPQMAGMFKVIQMLTDHPDRIQPAIDLLNDSK